jgi:glycosyltransferase involved in cell wall biosynthesis
MPSPNVKPHKLLYLSSVSGHDFRFIKKLKELEAQWQTLFVTMNSELDNEMRGYGVKTVNLNPGALPFDDWDRRGAYGLFVRRKLQKIFEQQHRPAFRKLLQDYQPDIVHSGWLQTDSYLAASEKQVPLLVMEWGTDILIRPSDNRRNFKKTKFVLSQADMIACDCKIAEEKSLMLLAGELRPILNFPWGIDRQLFNDAGRSLDLQMPLRIVMVKNLVPVSRLETMLQAAAKLKKTAKIPFTVDVYGEGAARPILEKELRDRQLIKEVKFHGRIPNAQVPEILRRSDLYLSCNASEGTSLALMEAMSCGVLPIVTKLPAYEEWIEDQSNGFTFAVGDSDALAVILRKIFTAKHDEIRRMREHNLKLAALKFDWDKNFLKLLRGYEVLLRKQGVPSTF